MFEFTDTAPQVEVQEAEYKRLLGFPVHHAMEGRTRELADAAREWYARNGRPWIYARAIAGVELSPGRVRLSGSEFLSNELHRQFSDGQADLAVVAAVSAGSECEAEARGAWQEGKPDEYFFMEAFGSAVVEQLITSLGGRICGWAEQRGMAVLPHYSPGYSGWDISDQIKLWRVLKTAGSVPGELEIMETGMLRPKKSLLALFGVTAHPDLVARFSKLVPCENCFLERCQYRRAAYRKSRPQIEDVRRLHPNGHQSAEAGTPIGVLDRNAAYTVNPKALRKWSQERLSLQFKEDGSIAARFRYEGTTCSNLGRPLEFHYQVTLAGRGEQYRITEASCSPAPGDTGHRFMCEYLSNRQALMNRIETEKPLLGRPLNEVFTWQRPVSPSGCYCDAERRAHKWGLVLEVIHFALVQHEQKTAENTYGLREL